MRKTQYAWMSLGGMICLFVLVLACKLRDGNRASAQPELPPPPVKEKAPPSIFTLPPTLPKKEAQKPTPLQTKEAEPLPLIQTKEPEPLPMVQTKEPEPLPPLLQAKEPELLPPPKKMEMAKEPALKPSEPKATLEMPTPSELMQSSPVLPASFGPNTPTASEKKHTKPAYGPVPPPAGRPLPPAYTIPEHRTPASIVIPASDHDSIKAQPGEPPLAPAPGPVQLYHVHGNETLQDITRRTLNIDRLHDVQKLNPTLKPDEPLHAGVTVRLPADACIQADDAEPVKPLPILHSKPPAPKVKALPLTGTYQCSLDEKGQLTLPRSIRNQLGGIDTVLLSPGPDRCLWLTNQPHLERLGERLDQSQANESDVRVFKRLYFAQTEKLTVNGDGRVNIPERLGQFAGLHQEVVLVGIDDHFEVWDAARWRSYTQQKSGGHSAAMADPE